MVDSETPVLEPPLGTLLGMLEGPMPGPDWILLETGLGTPVPGSPTLARTLKETELDIPVPERPVEEAEVSFSIPYSTKH